MPRIKKATSIDTVQLQPEVELTTKIPQEVEPPTDHDVVKVAPTKGKRSSKMSTPTPTPTPVPAPMEILDTPIELPKVRKPKFKEIHIKDTYWVENDIYQTIADMTKGNKGAKALIFNQALKDYLKKNKIEIIPFVDKDKKNK